MKLSARSSDELRIYSTESTIYSTQNKFVLPKSYYGNYFKINAQIFKQLNGLFEKSSQEMAAWVEGFPAKKWKMVTGT